MLSYKSHFILVYEYEQPQHRNKRMEKCILITIHISMIHDCTSKHVILSTGIESNCHDLFFSLTVSLLMLN
jgi:hypothetical protein